MDFTRIIVDGLRAAVGPEAAVYALLAIGLNIHFGYTGLLNFGQIGFALVGAYGVGITVITFNGPLWLGVIVGIAMAVVLALILGIPTLRLRADYLAIVTIAAAEILRFIFRASPSIPLTGGVFGLQQFAGPFYNVNPIPPGNYGFWLFDFGSHRRLWVMLVGWGLVALCSLLVFALMRSPWGRVIKSIREDEDAARSLGKNVFNYKMQALVLGGVMGALGGMVLAFAQQNVYPDTYLPQLTFFAYTILILGGPARVGGPLVGAVLFWFLFESMGTGLRQAATLTWWPWGSGAVGAFRLMAVGLGLMLLMSFRPQGIFGDRREMQLDV
jgi:branched-chain amino acid transport system permease protein